MLQIIIGNISKGSAFWEKLTQQTVDVFIRATLPRGIRLTKIHLHARCFSQFLMSSKLLAVVHGKAFLQPIGNSRKGLNGSFVECIVLPVVNSKSDKIARFPFNMSSKAAGLSHSENGITLPVTEASTVFRTGRAFAYRCSIWNFAALVLGFALFVFPFKTHDFL